MKELSEIIDNNISNPNLAELIKQGIKDDYNLERFWLGRIIPDINQKDVIEIYYLLKEKGLKLRPNVIFPVINCGYFEVLALLVTENYDINFANEYGHNSLFQLIRQGYLEEDKLIEVFRKSVELGINYDIEDSNAENLLHCFAQSGKPAYYLDQLLNLKLDINKVNKQGWTPLHLASRYRSDDEVLEKLIHNGADLTIKTKIGDSLFETYEYNAYEIKLQFLNGIGGELSKGTHGYNSLKEKYMKLLMPN